MFPKLVLTALYIVIQKSENFLNKKSGKITKRAHVFKGYPSSYYVGA